MTVYIALHVTNYVSKETNVAVGIGSIFLISLLCTYSCKYATDYHEQPNTDPKASISSIKSTASHEGAASKESDNEELIDRH